MIGKRSHTTNYVGSSSNVGTNSNGSGTGTGTGTGSGTGSGVTDPLLVSITSTPSPTTSSSSSSAPSTPPLSGSPPSNTNFSPRKSSTPLSSLSPRSMEGKNRTGVVEVGISSRIGVPSSWQQATASPNRTNLTASPSTTSAPNDEPPLSSTTPFAITSVASQSTLIGMFSNVNVSASLVMGGSGDSKEPLLSPRTKTQLTISLEGWLKKKGKEGIKLMRRWKSRWFQYQNLKLYYYLSPADVKGGASKAKGFIDLALVESIQTNGEGSSGDKIASTASKWWYFDIITPKRTYVLAAEAESAYNHWVEQLGVLLKILENSSHNGGSNNTLAMGHHRVIQEDDSGLIAGITSGGSSSAPSSQIHSNSFTSATSPLLSSSSGLLLPPTPGIPHSNSSSSIAGIALNSDLERLEAEKEDERTVYRLFKDISLPGEDTKFMTLSVNHIVNTTKEAIVGRLFVTNYRVVFIPSPKQPCAKKIDVDPDDLNLTKETRLELFANVEAGDLPSFGRCLSTVTTDSEQQRYLLQKVRHPFTNYCLLTVAVESRREKFIEELISNGCSANRPDDKGFTPFLTACLRGDLESCVTLLRKGAVANLATADGSYPLHYLVRLPFTTGLEDVIELLFKCGADVEATNMNGETPLHLANDLEVIQILLNHKADVNAIDGRGETCLHKVICRAPQKDQETIRRTVEFLLEKNADTSISGTRLQEVIDQYQLSYLKPLLAKGKSARAGNAESSSATNNFADGNMSLSTVVSQQGRSRVHKISLPLMLIESIRERSKVRSVDIMTKHLRFCRFVFGDASGASDRKAYSEAERKAFVEAIKHHTPKSPRDIFTFPFAQHEIESSWNPADIDIYSWDSNNSMPTPLGLSHRNLVSFSTGRSHTAALSMEGDVWVWGSGTQGQLGLGGVERSWNPQRIPPTAFGGQKIQKVYCGGFQTAAVTEQGKLYLWGDCGIEPEPEKPEPKPIQKSPSVLNKWPPAQIQVTSSPQQSPQRQRAPQTIVVQQVAKQASSSSVSQATPTPSGVLRVPTLAKGFSGRTISHVALGINHACVIVNEGGKTTAFSWGKNSYGQLGLKDTVDRKEPTLIKDLINPINIASGPYHLTTFTENRQIFTWGRCVVGHDAKSTAVTSPTLVESLSGKALRDLSCGNDFTVVVFQNGEVYSWGDGKRGTLGHGNCSSISTPKLIERLSGKRIERVSCGNRHTVAYNGTSLWAWGSLVEKTGLVVDQTYPKKIKSLAAKRVFRVSCGWRQSLAMLVEDPFDLLVEFRRQGVPNCYWRLCTINTNYSLCSSYPRYLIVPRTITDEVIQECGKFRTQGRIPCLTYKHSKNYATITRSSQPSVGLSGRRCPEDEKFLRCIVEANPHSDGVLYVLDARPKANAVANQAVGAGYELSEYYKNLKIQFLGIENIHLMRESLHKLTNICRQKKVREGGEKKTSSNWLSELESTHWIDHIVTILASARMLTELVLKGKSAHVHCSDGWDRTTQLVCLAQLMLDPYFRTIRGFQVLIEKDWLRFGHRFGDRQGHFPDTSGSSQASPIFLQFLDCVWQCTKQFPTSFEFNTRFLIKIFDHSHSGKYANFFCNSDRERRDLLRSSSVYSSSSSSSSSASSSSSSSSTGTQSSTGSSSTGTGSAHSSMVGDNGEDVKLKGACLWERMQKKASKYRNPDYLFSARNEELLPIANLKAVRLWRDFFFRWETSYR